MLIDRYTVHQLVPCVPQAVLEQTLPMTSKPSASSANSSSGNDVPKAAPPPLLLLRTLCVMIVVRSRADWHAAAASSMSFQQRAGYSAKQYAELADLEQTVMAMHPSGANTDWPQCCVTATAFVPLLTDVEGARGRSVRYSMPTTLPFLATRSDASDASMATHSSDLPTNAA